MLIFVVPFVVSWCSHVACCSTKAKRGFGQGGKGRIADVTAVVGGLLRRLSEIP